MIEHIKSVMWMEKSSFHNKPNSPLKGSIFFDPGTNTSYVYDGNHWIEFTMEGHEAPNPKNRKRKINKIYE